MFFYFQNSEEDIVLESKNDPKLEKKEKTNLVENEMEDLISVDIKGEVIAPGMYSVQKNMRILDVINQAGGLTENADTTVINLSKKVSDEMVIIIYSKEQIQHFEETKKQEEFLQEKCRMPEENSIVNDACIGTNSNSSDKVNINSATKEQLMSLNGIGEAKANEIISYRNQNGDFQSIEEIKNVPGIGENIYAQIKESITV